MATKSIAWNDGSGDYITLTYTGQGNGSITASSPANKGSARSKTITINTTQGGLITKNITISQAACPIPVGTVLNYAYTGSYQEVTLPAGQYKLQCWGAQGGSNAADSTYDITAQAGGKGGYSEGIITLSQSTTFRVYVGGQGSSSAGGFNGGGSTSGSASYDSSDINGVSRMGGGGGATDIRLSDGALLSRMIVAGGGSGGAMCYKAETITTYDWVFGTERHVKNYATSGTHSATFALNAQFFTHGATYRVSQPQGSDIYELAVEFYSGSTRKSWTGYISPETEFVVRTQDDWDKAYLTIHTTGLSSDSPSTFRYDERTESQYTSTSNSSQVGFAGGGTTGGGYSSTYKGKQNAAGSGGSFGQGANQTTTNYRFCSGAGGGGWYGGGMDYGDGDMNNVKCSGGGSGFVNTAASAGNRPSGYNGLQLDSGSTTAGSSSFPAPGGGNETGHAGNGHARITRLS